MEILINSYNNMKYIILSDTHGKHNIPLPDGDILIHCGDWSMRGDEIESISFLQWFQSQPHKHKVFIAGNHDWICENNANYFKELVINYAPDCVYLCNSETIINGLKIYGSPITPTFFDWAFNKERGLPIKQYWEQIPDDVDILITHGPPQNILDLVTMAGSPNNDQHVGCADLSDVIFNKLTKLKLHCFGHIHDQYGNLHFKNKIFINASLLNDKYKLVNKPIEVKI